LIGEIDAPLQEVVGIGGVRDLPRTGKLTDEEVMINASYQEVVAAE
jgi:hypothetical protein